MEDLIRKAVSGGQLLESSGENLLAFLRESPGETARGAVRELLEDAQWGELNDRFFQTLAFGTGGLRGRAIGAKVTRAERGNAPPDAPPEHPCVGTNAMNFENVTRATRGLAAYVREWHAARERPGLPGVCVCHDTRYFSRAFAERAARVLTEEGCDALLFEGFRSTPELSFAIRQTGATAGVNITASHNPPAYNGYKVYFEDGGQIVEPHASGIIAKVREAAPADAGGGGQRGEIHALGAEIDAAYMERLQTLPLRPELFADGGGLRVVYSALHGTGGVIIRPLLAKLGVQFTTVPEQDVPDGGFPTVKLPNPEAHEALTLAIARADKEDADIVLATDPDGDRMGAAARGGDGGMHPLTGNQIGSLLAWYRTMTLFELGVLNDANRSRATLIKTFVTTDLQHAIAEAFGVACVETLTGFKYIGAKLRKYEEALPEEARTGYAALSEEETRDLRLRYSRYFIFGGEESYGYSGADFVRDKDANSAAVMFAEVAAYAKSQRKTVLDLLDDIYRAHGFFLERGESLTLEGAAGADKIYSLVASYRSNPPREFDGVRVVRVRDFGADQIRDCEGDVVPGEAMLMFDLQDRRRIAVRPSGTEPKVKFYLFASRCPDKGKQLGAEELVASKKDIPALLDQTWRAVRKDAESRLGD